jgi:hypothetical protein
MPRWRDRVKSRDTEIHVIDPKFGKYVLTVCAAMLQKTPSKTEQNWGQERRVKLSPWNFHIWQNGWWRVVAPVPPSNFGFEVTWSLSVTWHHYFPFWQSPLLMHPDSNKSSIYRRGQTYINIIRPDPESHDYSVCLVIFSDFTLFVWEASKLGQKIPARVLVNEWMNQWK